MRKKLLFVGFLTFFTGFIHAQMEYWGVTQYGGANDAGVLFKTDANGLNQSVKHSFVSNDGQSPNGELAQHPNGKLYGVFASGGQFYDGGIYSVDTSSNVVTLEAGFSFYDNGKLPAGKPYVSNSGLIYGSTGTVYLGDGTIYSYDVNQKEINLLYTLNTADGSYPNSGLIEYGGKLYGTTSNGGPNGGGTLFSFDTLTSTFTVLKAFGGITGAYPGGELSITPLGVIYGHTSQGGTNNEGLIYSYNILTSTYTVEAEMNNVATGKNPVGGLTFAPSGLLYGINTAGGVNDAGVLYSFDPQTSTIVSVLDFDGSTIGYSPYSRPKFDANGLMYLIPSYDDVDYGKLITYNVNTSIATILYSFDEANGDYPNSLFITDNGLLFGTTQYGGIIGDGVVFKYNPTSAQLSNIYNFNYSQGFSPVGGLVKSSKATLLGLAYDGGDFGDGVIYEYDPNKQTFTKKIDLEEDLTGYQPTGSLMRAANGKYYATMESGGSEGDGTILEYDYDQNTASVLVHFDNNLNAETPNGDLIQAANGKLYGLSYYGGANGDGVLFEIDITAKTITNKVDFGGANGLSGLGKLLEASNGKLYGVRQDGGLNSDGVLFEYDPTNSTYAVLHNFTSTSGYQPMGTLVEDNGKLVGITQYGGLNGDGVVFNYNLATSTYSAIYDISYADDGESFSGNILKASNGKYYGMMDNGVSNGEDNDMGAIFEFNPTSNVWSVTHEFADSTGRNPEHNGLYELPICFETAHSYSEIACEKFIAPSGKVYTTPGTYMDTILNKAGCDSVLTIQLTMQQPPIVSITNNNGVLSTATSFNTYQWYNCSTSTEVSGATSSNYTPTVAGDYALIADDGTCSDTSDCVTVTSLAGLTDLESSIFSVSPNPTNGDIMVYFEGIEQAELTIIASTGQSISTRKVQSNDVIDVNNLDAGIYIFQLKRGDNITNQRVVKQ
ncbi:MAG: T9SS type A sorting domain-containing protein [Bacteroidetes bacterium]|nr:T9SS type A sorting domain-containing protein [Bacteroidota bacterium]